MVYHTILPERKAEFGEVSSPWPEELGQIFNPSGFLRLYRHQAEAIDRVRSGQHTVVATPTASGKTMIYNLPALERILRNPRSRALYLFPLKALAQDQLRTFEALASRVKGITPAAAIYDGDTSAWDRRRIREKPPHVLLTNPEMLHLSFLPHHGKWFEFLSNLNLVVVDEVHTYRGIMGTHMAQVFRRFLRICGHCGASPTFVFSSATVGNPDELAEQLTGLQVSAITQSGAPRGRKHLVFIDPLLGPAQAAILLLKAALHRGLRTIVYCQSRKLTELMAIWASSRSGAFAGRISAYRAGFLPEERRQIEARLSNGDLLAVITTSALELGIDIGDLDLCLLVGYPGTIVATWQRGGRVGRSGQDSALVLIAGEDALDQYFIRNPFDLIAREPEAAVVNPYNKDTLKRHLLCAAAEKPLQSQEAFLAHGAVQQAVHELEQSGDLLRSEDGGTLYSKRTQPHRDVDLRGTGSRFNIACAQTGSHRGEVDGFRAFRETHPGAVYIHNGETFLVETLDLGTMTVRISPAKVDYYTRVRAYKETEILDTLESRTAWGTRVFTGRLKVTDQVTGYEKWQMHARKKLNILPLNLPPQTFETEGIWFRIPIEVQKQAEAQYLHFMGGIHAVEHAAIGIFPLLVMADRNDLGGISTPFHPQVGGPAVFIYDGVPGGAGLSRQAFRRAESLLETTLTAIATCPCELGCPSCVHSPKCGSGNRPIDKNAAVFILNEIKSGRFLQEDAALTPSPSPSGRGENTLTPAPSPSGRGENALTPGPSSGRGENELLQGASSDHPIPHPPSSPPKQTIKADSLPPNPSPPLHYGVFDLETRRSAEEVGGWHQAGLMGVSCAVVYDSKSDQYLEFFQDQIDVLADHLKTYDMVIGFNIKRFDYAVLKGLSDYNFSDLPTLDLLEHIYRRLGYRLSLDHLAQTTLDERKSADGLKALQWWKEGKIKEIIQYCRMDVRITRDLYLHGRDRGYLLFKNKAGNTVRLPVDW